MAKYYDVWMEGYSCTGQSKTHEFIGSVKAESFEQACEIAVKNGHASNIQRERVIELVKNGTVIQTKNKKDLMLLDIINTGISMCKQHNKLEDIISYLKKSLEQLEENEEDGK